MKFIFNLIKIFYLLDIVGCRITVDTMVKKSSAKLADMQAARVDTKQTVEAAELVKELCDEPNFNTYRPFAKYSCVKLLNENATSFLLPFEGSFSPSFISAKGDIFDKTKEVRILIHSSFVKISALSMHFFLHKI